MFREMLFEKSRDPKIEVLLGNVFYTLSVSYYTRELTYLQSVLPAEKRIELLRFASQFLCLRHRDCSGTQRSDNVDRWKPLPLCL
jgi:hypothetical protein